MTNGEIEAERLPAVMAKIKKLMVPIALLAAIAIYFLIIPSLLFAGVFFVLFLLTSFDEYRIRSNIVNSPEKIKTLKNIEDKRQAAVFVNGGFLHELKHMALITILIIWWFYVT